MALDSDGNMSNENWSASAQETLIQMKARTMGILDAEFTTDFDKATGGPAATIDNTISVILNERVTSENQKEFDMESRNIMDCSYTRPKYCY